MHPEQQILEHVSVIGVGDIISGLVMLLVAIAAYMIKEDRSRIRELEKTVARLTIEDDDTSLMKEIGKQEMINDKQWEILNDLRTKITVLETKMSRTGAFKSS